MNKSPRAHLSNDIQNYYQGQKWLIGALGVWLYVFH